MKKITKKTAIVSTSIRVPKMFEDYSKNIKENQLDNIELFMIGDRKTPDEARHLCEKLASDYNIPINYLGIKDQEEILKDYPNLKKIVPYDSACRKILGMLIAYLGGFKNLITVDDDNFLADKDFFIFHDIAGSDVELPLIKSSSGWFNSCEHLIEESNVPFYYRGFPWSQRKIKKDPITIHKEKVHVIVNSGFWFEDPDIDAVSRLFWPIRVTGMKPELAPNFGLFPGTWCPFNNQNTAMASEILPAYFTPHNARRFSDLWPAYVVSCIASHLNHVISYGRPFVNQIRNPHNYWQDIDEEKVGAQATEPLLTVLRSANFKKNNYHDCLGELIVHLNKNRDFFEKQPKEQKEMIFDFLQCLKVWHETFNLIISKNKQ